MRAVMAGRVGAAEYDAGSAARQGREDRTVRTPEYPEYPYVFSPPAQRHSPLLPCSRRNLR